MARTTKNALYASGPVHVYVRPDDRHRMVATVGGKQIERSGSRDLDGAKTRADAWAVELGMPNPAVHGGSYFREAIVAFLEAPHPGWGRNHRDRFEGFARNHLIPALGSKRNNQLNATMSYELLEELAKAGYSWSLVSGVFTLLKAVVKHGRNTGVWQPAFDPIYGLGMPPLEKFARTVTNTTPGEVLPLTDAELPTERETAALISSTRHWRSQRSLLPPSMRSATASTGVRVHLKHRAQSAAQQPVGGCLRTAT